MASDERALGLILRARPLTETSLIIHWLTPDLGRLATVAKAARRGNSPFRGKLDVFFLAEFSFARSRRSELHTLREISLRGTNDFLRRDLGKLQQAAYVVALLEQTTETETPIPIIFQLLQNWLAALESSPPGPLLVFAFEIKLLEDLGLLPDIDETSLSAGTKEIVRHITLNFPAVLQSLRPSADQSRELQYFLHGFLVHHLGHLPRGRSTALNTSDA